MKKPLRPFAARIPFEDKTRLAIAQTLDRREELDLSHISRQVLMRNHAYLYQYLFKGTPRTLDYADAVKLASFLNLDTAVFLPDTNMPARLSDPYRASFNTSRAGEDMVPVRGPASGSGDAILLDEEDIGRVAQHPAQKGMADAFAFYAAGEGMAPRYRPGELVFAVMGKPPVRGQDCIVELHNGEGYLMEFERRDKDIIGRLLNPLLEWRRPATEVKAVHAVVGRG